MITKRDTFAIGVIIGVIATTFLVVFSPPEPVADTSLVEAPALADFSSPSSEVASIKSATFISCLDLQRELNRRDPTLKLVEDGICGPATMAAWNEVVFNGYALEFWPEDAK